MQNASVFEGFCKGTALANDGLSVVNVSERHLQEHTPRKVRDVASTKVDSLLTRKRSILNIVI